MKNEMKTFAVSLIIKSNSHSSDNKSSIKQKELNTALHSDQNIFHLQRATGLSMKQASWTGLIFDYVVVNLLPI